MLLEKVLKIQNKLGLHARAAALFVQTANRYASNVTIEKDGVEVNGKSIMGIMMLAAAKGNEVTVRAVGQDEQEALDTIEKLIIDKFHEGA
ncbi:MAG TPA: HPr family phosphocarrier protein [Nitrospirota bacterium]